MIHLMTGGSHNSYRDLILRDLREKHKNPLLATGVGSRDKRLFPESVDYELHLDEPRGTRTLNLMIKSHLLCQLS